MREHIVLVNPEIPQNTGNIARLCVALHAVLHLIYPLGFSIDSKYTKRAGLDYWDKLELQTHDNIESFFAYLQNNHFVSLENPSLFHHYALSSKAQKSYFDDNLVSLDSQMCFLYFGSETKGLSIEFQILFEKIHGQYLTIPMAQNCRCLNLSNSVAIMGYEIWRQYYHLHK